MTRRLGGLQAFKVIVPPHDRPEPYGPKAREGYEWIDVLHGRLHLILGHRKPGLGPGEVAVFDTRTPHIIANRRDHPTGMLALFGPQG